MRIPRMTTRRWMVVVAAVGVLFWSGRVRARWVHCKWRAYQHAEEEQYEVYLASPDYKVGVCGMYQRSSRDDEALTVSRRRAYAMRDAAYHSRVKAKFERAAWRPWEPLPDDPFDPPDPF